MGSPTDARTPAATAGTFDLLAAARQTVAGAGFEVDFSPQALAEVARLPAAPPTLQPGVQDLRALLWSSIDNADSRDLDQIEVAEALPGGDVRVLVGIADVDALVPKGSALDARAARNTASVYTGPAHLGEATQVAPLAAAQGQPQQARQRVPGAAREARGAREGPQRRVPCCGKTRA